MHTVNAIRKHEDPAVCLLITLCFKNVLPWQLKNLNKIKQTKRNDYASNHIFLNLTYIAYAIFLIRCYTNQLFLRDFCLTNKL